MKFVVMLILLLAVVSISCDKSDMVIPPRADFKVDSTILFINDTIQFINLCEEIENDSDATSFQWYFEGGNPEYSNLSSPVVTYPNPGSFLVKLIATNINGQDSISKPDFIKIYGMHVGKSDGINVIHKFFSQSQEKFDSIDINADGIFDIQFEHISSCCRYRIEDIYVKCINQTQISGYENLFNAKKHMGGDIISPQLFWRSGSFCISGISQIMQGNGSTTYSSCGEFNSYNLNGFICFKINNEIYGWINLSAYTSFFGSSLGITDYAYFSIQ